MANPRTTSCGLSKEMLASWELQGEALGLPFMPVQLQSLNPLLSCSHAHGVGQQEWREVGLLWGLTWCRHLLLGCRQGSWEAQGEGNSSSACWHAELHPAAAGEKMGACQQQCHRILSVSRRKLKLYFHWTQADDWKNVSLFTGI